MIARMMLAGSVVALLAVLSFNWLGHFADRGGPRDPWFSSREMKLPCLHGNVATSVANDLPPNTGVDGENGRYIAAPLPAVSRAFSIVFDGFAVYRDRCR